MELTLEQSDLLIRMINASVNMSANSGIPIDNKYSKEIEEIKKKIKEEITKELRKEEKEWFLLQSKKKD